MLGNLSYLSVLRGEKGLLDRLGDLNQDSPRLRSGYGIRGWTKIFSDGRAQSRPGAGSLLALYSTIISPKFVGAYRIRPQHGFEPGFPSTVIEAEMPLDIHRDPAQD
ncbi:hypothetical protein [Sphingobacterium mizutaii]|uniref:hypothetical protein n=1 Tax=Sphingobacterium mizutaii TaxID=1010 RepID=UPI0028966B62|nr:hypothetical protein [Sphingobacterium mizutaii]